MYFRHFNNDTIYERSKNAKVNDNAQTYDHNPSMEGFFYLFCDREDIIYFLYQRINFLSTILLSFQLKGVIPLKEINSIVNVGRIDSYVCCWLRFPR